MAYAYYSVPDIDWSVVQERSAARDLLMVIYGYVLDLSPDLASEH